MINYGFYTNAYRGVSIDLLEWPVYEARASDQLARYKRMYTVTAPDENAEAMAVCAMADALAYFAAVQNGTAVTSTSIGSVSVSYGSAPGSVDMSPKGQSRELYRCASQYLDIYRGVG
jgi:hypothetical protein